MKQLMELRAEVEDMRRSVAANLSDSLHRDIVETLLDYIDRRINAKLRERADNDQEADHAG